MKKYVKVEASLSLPLSIEFEIHRHYTKKELEAKILEKLKTEISFVFPDIEYLDTDITNIKSSISDDF